MPRNSGSSDGAVLRSALSALNRRLRAEEGVTEVGPTGLGLLALLLSGGPMTAGDLADLAYAQPQSLTRPLRALEDADLIGRRVDEDDRRRAILSISPQGEELVRTTMRKRIAWLNSTIAANLTEDERVTLRSAADLLARIAGGEIKRRERAVDDRVFSMIPFTLVADPKRSVAYYEPLGFVCDGMGEREGNWFYASLRGLIVKSSRIMFARSCDPIVPDQQRVSFYCWTDDIVALHARLTASGYKPSAIDAPEHMLDGEFLLTDPDGYVIKVGQPERKRNDRTEKSG